MEEWIRQGYDEDKVFNVSRKGLELRTCVEDPRR
jgi:hypothetical protein